MATRSSGKPKPAVRPVRKSAKAAKLAAAVSQEALKRTIANFLSYVPAHLLKD